LNYSEVTTFMEFMEEIIHERLPSLAAWDGVKWLHSAVCGRMVTSIELASPGRRPTCPQCLSDLGLSDRPCLPHTSTVAMPAGWIRPRESREGH